MKEKQKTKEMKKKQGLVQKILLFTTQKRGFVVAVIVTLLAILIILVSSMQTSDSMQNAAFASELFQENQANLLEYRVNVDEQLALGFETTLDDDYLYSMRDDLDWMINKEKELYNSKPNNEVYLKEIAFTLSAQKIIEINDAFSFEIGEPKYEEKIALAMSTDINTPTLLTQSELIESFTTGLEREKFLFYTKQIFDEYAKEKKILIQNTNSIERKYVEAKKLLLLAMLNE
ncbi:MAG: hypothetical protein WC462_04965 [archaeon]